VGGYIVSSLKSERPWSKYTAHPQNINKRQDPGTTEDHVHWNNSLRNETRWNIPGGIPLCSYRVRGIDASNPSLELSFAG
jgi:hypothetical protein